MATTRMLKILVLTLLAVQNYPAATSVHSEFQCLQAQSQLISSCSTKFEDLISANISSACGHIKDFIQCLSHGKGSILVGKCGVDVANAWFRTKSAEKRKELTMAYCSIEDVPTPTTVVTTKAKAEEISATMTSGKDNGSNVILSGGNVGFLTFLMSSVALNWKLTL